jgi:hypothetical protein
MNVFRRIFDVLFSIFALGVLASFVTFFSQPAQAAAGDGDPWTVTGHPWGVQNGDGDPWTVVPPASNGDPWTGDDRS